VSIRSHAERKKLESIGKIVRLTLDEMSAAVRPGVTTAELDTVAATVLAREGAESSPPKVYGFPGTACISVNDEAIHGIPGRRKIEEGDLVKLDVTAEKDGFVADAAVTIRAGKTSATAEALARCAESAFRQALKVAQVGNRVYEIGRAVEREVRRCGFSVIKELCGHGVGRTIHEEPQVPNYFERRCRGKLTDGLVITIEPIISAGNGRALLAPDKWTVRTADRSLSAHYEHTIVITHAGPVLLTVLA
jgi:methionyl aminopeptidase